jgi:hypothetical protein
MNSRFVVRAIALTGLVAGLFGCGTGVGTGAGKSAAADSAACISCHSAQSKVTGVNIVEEWKSSRHYSMNAAGCNDCHETNTMHGGNLNSCAGCHGGGAPRPADANGKCGKCHGVAFPEDVMMTYAPQHYNANAEKSAIRFLNSGGASFVSEQLVAKCRTCHNPHNPTTYLQYNRYWAQGGMGDVTAGARTSRDFKGFGTNVPANLAYINSSPSYANFTGAAAVAQNLDVSKNVDKFGRVYTPVCVRCHTTTGFVNFVESGFVSQAAFGSDKTKEVTDCRACHVDYDFSKNRRVNAVKLYYTYSASTQGVRVNNIATQYPDFGKSNLCIPCHAGRGAGSIIKNLPSGFFTNGASPSGHDFSGAGTIAGLTGYHFGSNEYVVSPVDHENIGMSTSGTDTFKGPCVACHMNTANRPQSHMFMAIEHSTAKFDTYTTGTVWPYSVSTNGVGALKVNEMLSRTCSNYACHVGTGTSAITVDSMNADKLGYISALTVLNRWLLEAKANYKTAVPTNGNNNVTTPGATGATTITDWEFFSAGSGPDTMGASFNLGLLNNEPGGYAHRPTYVKRLIHDSIAHLAQLSFPLKDADAVNSAIRGASHGQTVITAATRRLPPEITAAARTWMFGRYTSASPTSFYKARRPGD